MRKRSRMLVVTYILIMNTSTLSLVPHLSIIKLLLLFTIRFKKNINKNKSILKFQYAFAFRSTVLFDEC